MKIGINATGQTPWGSVSAYVTHALAAEADGFDSYWVPELPTGGVDALTVLTVIGQSVQTMELGTAIVPTYPRHPMALAAQALTVNASVQSRFTLGIGLSHQSMMEPLGLGDDKPIRHLREYLDVLGPLLAEGKVDFRGETIECHAQVLAKSDAPPSVLVAALGPQALRVAGSRTTGTTLAWVGPKTIASHIVPTLRKAAEEAGRPEPRIVATLPVCVTDRPEEVRASLRKIATMYANLPSYRAMLDREGVDEPTDLGVIGSRDEVTARIAELATAGVTDFGACEIGGTSEDRLATRDLLRTLAKAANL
jgi:F420-dependent oxidoreductase-like protein